MACCRAALDAIKPPVRSPSETVRDRVRIFETKTGKADLGVAIGDVVFVAIGVEQQIGRGQHKDTAAPDCHAAGNIQSRDKVLVRLEKSVTVLVFEDGNLVGA